jgi:parvulin-like peptidyl-prolyl isomerase
MLLTALVAVPCSADDWPNGNGSMMQPVPPLNASPSSFQQRPIVPGPPVQPGEGARPASWPGGPPVDPSRASRSAQPVPGVAMQPCDGAQIVAHVGSEAILDSEVKGEVNHMVQQLIEKNKKSISPQELETLRSQTLQRAWQSQAAVKQALQSCIQRRLIYQDAKKNIPAEGWTQVEKDLQKRFEETQLEAMMKEANVQTRADLDKKLRAQGTSLEHEKRVALERVLAGEWVRSQVKRDEESPTYDQMLTYYREHQDQFTTPARAQYEELMVRYPDAKYPNKDAAMAAIAEMGNRVWSGVPFAAVARAGSDGATAADGGQRPWTTKGALACQAMDEALFRLPIGQLSLILESPQGYHIVRVTRREDAAVKDFLDAQVEIKEKIVQQRSEKQLKEYLETKTPVWTIFDSDINHPQLARRPGDTVK